jgi:hypothetical protein
MSNKLSKKDVARLEAKRRFDKLYPMLRWILSEVQLTEQLNDFEVCGYKFLARLNNGVVEFGSADERPIFPTVAFEIDGDHKLTLLTFRCAENLFTNLYRAHGQSKDQYYSTLLDDQKNED